MQVKTIAGHDLMPGKTVKDHIHVEGTELHVPHVLLCGDQPGKTVLITAGIHNAEYVGIQAAIELSNELDVSALRGNVIIVPLANRSGFENRTMSMVYEDGKNLNRVFPGDREGSEADKLAHMLFEVFIQNVDAYIDLHSGDDMRRSFPSATTWAIHLPRRRPGRWWTASTSSTSSAPAAVPEAHTIWPLSVVSPAY